MPSLNKLQSEAVASIDTAKALIDKVLTIMDIMINLPSISANASVNPFEFLMMLLEKVATYEQIRDFIVKYIMWVVPGMEIALKAVLLTNLKSMVSCSIDPRIPEKYRKQHKSINDRNTPNEYGIDIDIESIDYLNKLSVSPLNTYAAQNFYFGINGVDNVYKFARADDFDAFLWFVIHKGKFPMTTNLSANLGEFNNRIHGSGEYSIAESNPSLFKELNLTPSPGSSSSILPGNTFGYKNAGPNIVSMCIDAPRNPQTGDIIKNTIVPLSDDLTSVNWYVRPKDYFTENLFGSIIHKDGSTKTRDYGEEKAICNLQYIEPAYGDQEIMGIANNKVRFTILPKPYIHTPDITHGEPRWRFKRLLFDNEGNYDPNGRLTISDGEESYDAENNAIKIVTGNTTIYIDIKSGDVSVTTAGNDSIISKLVECYKGLTVYEFNYDYVMGMRFFDAKVLAATLIQSLRGISVGVNFSLQHEYKEATARINTIIKEIIEQEEVDISDCLFTFDNDKYDALLEEARKKRAKGESFGRTGSDIGSYDEIDELLKEYDSAATYHEKEETLKRVFNKVAVEVTEGTEEVDNYNVQFSFITDLLQNLITAIMNALLSPKVLMVLEVNQRLMGGTWKKFSVEDLLKSMRTIIVSMVKELRDMLIQELIKFLMTLLDPIKELLNSLVLREQLEYYAEALEHILKDCPIIWFRFANQFEEAKIDTVDYADIDTTTSKEGEKIIINRC